MAIQAQQRYGFKRIIDGKTLSFVISPNHLSQIMSKNPLSFNPDFATKKLVLTPVLTVSGGGGENQVIKECEWLINGTKIAGVNNYGAVVGTTAPFALTINKNLVNDTSLLIECNYNYVTPATQLVTTVSTSLNIVRVENAGAILAAAIDNLDGNAFQTIGGEVKQLRFQGRMIKNGADDNTDVTYAWHILGTDGLYKKITAATAPAGSGLPTGNLFTNFTSNIITISSNAIINIGHLKCVVTDTDPASTTVGQSASAFVSVVDATDSLDIVIDYLQGDSMADSNASGLKGRFIIYQAGKPWPISTYNGKLFSFYRENLVQEKDTTFVPVAADFAGWTIGTGAKANEIYRTFATNNATDENRTILYQPKHLRPDMVMTMFAASIDF